jgi:hypothetical protein
MLRPGSQRVTNSTSFRGRGRLAALAIAVVPVTALVGCAAAADSDPGYSDPGYSDPGYSDPGYSDPGYSDPGYSDPGYSDPGYSDPGPGPSDTDPCAFAGDPLCPTTPIQVPPPDLGPPGGW